VQMALELGLKWSNQILYRVLEASAYTNCILSVDHSFKYVDLSRSINALQFGNRICF